MPRSLRLFAVAAVFCWVTGFAEINSVFGQQEKTAQESQATHNPPSAQIQQQANGAARTEQAVISTPWYTPLEKPDWWVLIIALTTCGVVFWQSWETRRAAEATRSSVEASRETARHQLRAYLTVVIGDALYQERRDDDKGGDLMFECRPLLKNTGGTPAHGLRFKARSAILPVPLPVGHHLPEGFDDIEESILGPQQDAHMTATVDGFCKDDQVDTIKHRGGDSGLYTWGRVEYKDIFGKQHSTQFCQLIYWDLKDNVRGLYVPGRNKAD